MTIFYYGIHAEMLYPTYKLNRQAGCSHDAIVAAVEAQWGGAVGPGTWERVQSWYAQVEESAQRSERMAIHRAYLAMLALEDDRYSVRVRSRVGMMRLLEGIFEGYPPTNRNFHHRQNPEPVKVRWSWPAAACARADRARPLIGSV